MELIDLDARRAAPQPEPEPAELDEAALNVICAKLATLYGQELECETRFRKAIEMIANVRAQRTMGHLGGPTEERLTRAAHRDTAALVALRHNIRLLERELDQHPPFHVTVVEGDGDAT